MEDTQETNVETFAAEMAQHILKGLGQEDNPLAVLIPSYIEVQLEAYRIMKNLDKTIEDNRRFRDGL